MSAFSQWLYRVPWRLVRQAVLLIRRNLYTVDVDYSDLPHVEIAASPDTVSRVLRQKLHFEDGSLTSYRYRGEDLNLRRPEGLKYGARQRQLHVRGWRSETGGTTLVAHQEYSPIQHPEMHLKDMHLHEYSSEELMDALIPALVSSDLETV